MGMGEKSKNYTKYENKRKNSSFGCPPIVPSRKWKPTVFRCLKTPKTSQTYRRLERGPSLVGQKIQGWALYGQMKAGNMIFILVNF